MQSRLTHVVIAILALTTSIYAQVKPEFTVDELKSDLEFLYDNLLEYNPAIGVFHPKEEFDETYRELYASINEPTSDLEFYPKVAGLLGAMHEGHTTPFENTDTITGVVKGFYNGDFRFIPMSIVYLKGDYFCTGFYGAKDGPAKGDRIISINGKAINDIIKEMSKYVQADGNSVLTKISVSCGNFGAQYYWFIDKPEQFEIEYYSDSTQQEESVTVEALPLDSMVFWRNERYGTPDPEKPSIDDVYTLTIEDEYAILDLSSFSRSQMEKYDIKPAKLYEEVFGKIHSSGVENLIVDLRDNNGGRKEYALEILPYIMKTDSSGLASVATSWKGKRIKYKLPKRSKLAFDGQLWVLVNNKSFSNASVVASYLKVYGEAIVIGQETRSRYEGFAAGSNQEITLPSTRITIYTPRYVSQYHPPQKASSNRGLLPDHFVNYTIEELLEEQDKEMDRALELISASQD